MALLVPFVVSSSSPPQLAYEQQLESEYPKDDPFPYVGLTNFQQQKKLNNVCFDLDRREMHYVSRPVVETGLWAAIAKDIDRVKYIYYKFVSDHGSLRNFPDRSIIMRLSEAIDSCDVLESAPDLDKNAATALMNAMLLVHPVKYMLTEKHQWYASWAAQSERIVKRDYGTMSFLRSFSRFQERYKTAQALDPQAKPRRWGTQTSVEALGEDLQALDRVDPLDPNFSPVYKMFVPADIKEVQVGSRQWRGNDGQLYYRVLRLVAQCLGEQNI